MPKIRVGLVGYGGHMKDKLLPAIKTLEKSGYEVEVVAICKKTMEGLEGNTVPVYTNYEELLDKNIVDALVVALPDPVIELHSIIAHRALELGIHVFVEKPLVLKMNILDMLAQDASEHLKVITAVGFNCVFAPVLADAREEILTSHADLTLDSGVKNYDTESEIQEVVRSGINFALIHPISVAVDLLGEPEDVKNIKVQPIDGKPNCFTLKAEIIYPNRKVILNFSNDAQGFKFTLDYPGKTLNLAAKGTITSGKLKGQSLRQAQYIEELRSFFDAINSGEQGKYSFIDPKMRIVHRVTRLILVAALQQLEKISSAKRASSLSLQKYSGLSSEDSTSQNDAESAVQLGLYEHSASGKKYEVTCVCRHSETLEPMIVYRALQGDYGIWVRPKNMFFENVIHKGNSVPRFKFIRPLNSEPPIVNTSKPVLKPGG